MGRSLPAGALWALVALLAAGCAGDDGDDERGAGPTTTVAARPAGPAADLSEELTGGAGVFVAAAQPAALEGTGYVEHEYVAAGTASSYRAEGALTGDGRWVFEPGGTAGYRTRVLVRRPPATAFSGTVVVEWLNVSSGLDAATDWVALRDELIRQGHAWVGVSAQSLGVMGGPVLVAAPGAEQIAGKGLRALDPARYGSLQHPGDAFSFDIFTQVARAVRAGGPAMGGLEPQTLLAAGQSQSAFALVTYVNGVQPLTRAFDGFFVHSRAAVGLPLVGAGEIATMEAALGAEPTILRTDSDVPALTLQTETDLALLNSIAARQADDDRFRLWEVAGTAHADTFVAGPVAGTADCGKPVNDAPLHVVAKAALRQLDRWVRTGEPPPKAARLETTAGASPDILRDRDGIAVGGVRTPPVDVPVDVLSGVPASTASTLCFVFGSTTPLPATRLAELYPSRAAYLERYREAADRTIDAGFVLDEDREALLAYASPSRLGE